MSNVNVLSCFTLDELNNDLDETAPHFRAWKVEMSLFVHKAKLNPSDLTAIDIDSGLEENTLSVLEEIISYRGDMLVHRSHRACRRTFRMSVSGATR